jgi:hypothetical protein
LLHRRESEGVFDLKISEASVWTIGADPEFAVLPKKGRLDSILGERSIVEATKHSRIRCNLHGASVM